MIGAGQRAAAGTAGSSSASPTMARGSFVTAVDLALLGLLLAAALVIARVYVASEDYLYSWDHRGYQDKTFDLASLLASAPGRALDAFRASLADDYNMVPSLPLVPVVLLLGESRSAYIAGVTAVYLVPFAFATGAVATRLVRGGGRRVFWGTAALTLVVPGLWPAALRGYPDVGGAALLAGALALFLGDRRGEGWLRLALVSAAVGLAVVFRRHLAYAAVVLLVAAGAELLLARRAEGWRVALLAGVPRALVIGLCAAAVVFLAGPDWARRALATDYRALYSSYEHDVAGTLRFLAGTWGLLVLALAALGYGLGLATGRLDGSAARVVLTFAALFLLVWVGFVRLVNEHLTYPATLVVALGIAGLLAVLLDRGGAIGKAAAALAVAAVLAVGATQLGALGRPGPLPAAALAWPAYPQRGAEHAAVAELVRRLADLGGAERAVLVASSSLHLNADLVRGADRALRGSGAARLRILVNPEVDSRDAYPLEALLAADLAVAVAPLQHHLPAAEQDVVRTAADQLLQNRGFGRQFVRLPGEIPFAGGAAVVTIHERAHRPDLAELVEAVRHTLADVGSPRPGGDLAWLAVDPGAAGTMVMRGRGAGRFGAAPYTPPGRG
jgi:hypothetical protein